MAATAQAFGRHTPGSAELVQCTFDRGAVVKTAGGMRADGLQQVIARLVDDRRRGLQPSQAMLQLGKVAVNAGRGVHAGSHSTELAAPANRCQVRRSRSSASWPAAVSRYVRRRRPTTSDQSLAM